MGSCLTVGFQSDLVGLGWRGVGGWGMERERSDLQPKLLSSTLIRMDHCLMMLSSTMHASLVSNVKMHITDKLRHGSAEVNWP